MLDDDDPRAESLAQLDDMVQGAWHRTAAHALLVKNNQEASLSKGMGGVSNSGRVGGGDSGSHETTGVVVAVRERSLQERLKMFDSSAGHGSGSGRGKDGGGGKKQEQFERFAIADFPPSLQLVPCKPRLLDLAYDDLEFPDLDERAGIEKVEEIVDAQTPSGAVNGGGVLGWVGWALGRT